ncbi:MAG TPA: hypothetical protein VEA69_02330 [Tepidisphaeraceae bacterium]|nr:hypothetical protein [Tepidisphaeraceae bacterium]
MDPYGRDGVPAAGRFVVGAVGFLFAGIGITVLIFLWAAPFDEWGSPPLFFRVFGSFIALMFVLVGGTVGLTAVRGKPASPMRWLGAKPPVAEPGPRVGGYSCPHCAAPLGAGADVSPSGDVKCTFCGRWFNVHRQGAGH